MQDTEHQLLNTAPQLIVDTVPQPNTAPLQSLHRIMVPLQNMGQLLPMMDMVLQLLKLLSYRAM